MSWSIRIGQLPIETPLKYIDGFPYYDGHIQLCIGKEPEGLTDPARTVDCGRPERSPSYVGWADFSRSYLKGDLHPPASDGFIFRLKERLPMFESLEPLVESAQPVDADRLKWLIFWSREAVKRYGQNAVIQFW